MSDVILGTATVVPYNRLAKVVGSAVAKAFRRYQNPWSGPVDYEDCFQQALLRVWEHRTRFSPYRGNGSWESWAWITAYREAKRMIEREIQHRDRTMSLETGVGEEEISLSEFLPDKRQAIEEVTTWIAFQQVARNLPQKTVRLILMRLAGYSNIEIMRSLSYAYSGPMFNRLVRARPYLRQQLLLEAV